MDESTGMDAAAEGETVAACALSCVPGMGASALARVAQEFGSLEHAVDAGSGALVAASSQLRLTIRLQNLCSRSEDPKCSAFGSQQRKCSSRKNGISGSK